MVAACGQSQLQVLHRSTWIKSGATPSRILLWLASLGTYIAVRGLADVTLPAPNVTAQHMDPEFSPTAVAERLRGILGGQDRGMIEASARRLGVSEVALRMSIDETDPHPAIEVLVAVVRAYGVDPSWLVSGVYDATTHRAAVEDEAAVTKEELARMITRRMVCAASSEATDSIHLRLEA